MELGWAAVARTCAQMELALLANQGPKEAREGASGCSVKFHMHFIWLLPTKWSGPACEIS